MSVARRSPLMSCTHQIHKQPYRSRSSRGQLPEERVSRVDVSASAILRDEKTAFLVRLVRIVTREQRLELIVPLFHEIEPALLYPTIEIFLGNLIRIMKNRIIGIEYLHRCFFDRHASAAQLGVVRG